MRLVLAMSVVCDHAGMQQSRLPCAASIGFFALAAEAVWQVANTQPELLLTDMCCQRDDAL